MAAAPLDFRPKNVSSRKIKKSKGPAAIELEPTPDILEDLGKRKNGKILAGFAAETEDFNANAKAKLRAKNLDLIVVNPVGGPDSGFDSDTNKASIIDAAAGVVRDIPLMSKSRMADTVLDHVAALLSRNGTSKK
jgi:phosphopantothenoylcysteine decarboxylase/phosphopantothenate--cysteine ligase